LARLAFASVRLASHTQANCCRGAGSRQDGRRALGRLGESLAAAHLERRGFSVIERNARTRYGEIDLIAFDGRTLVFAEVKTRRARGRQVRLGSHEPPLGALRPRQQAQLRRLALAWLSDGSRRRPTARTIRFDAVGVT